MAIEIEVLEAGLLTTIQDAGRRGFEHLGVPRSGAADPTALAIANLVAGNETGLAALECTLLGPRLRARTAAVIGLAGADFGARIMPGSRRLSPGSAARLEPGDTLEFTAAGDVERGCRAYVAIAGGFDVPIVLGSRSTSLVGGFGGFQGRPLRAGDVLSAGRPAAAGGLPPLKRWPTKMTGASPSGTVRILVVARAGDALVEGFLATEWSVSHESDRRGLRLIAADAAATAALMHATDRPSAGVMPGAIQLTPSGQPLVLMPDAGTTGGYPVIGVVIDADLGTLGQFVPGSTIRFVAVNVEDARSAAIERRQALG